MSKKKKEKTLHIAEFDMRHPEVLPHKESVKNMREKPHYDSVKDSDHSQNTTTHD